MQHIFKIKIFALTCFLFLLSIDVIAQDSIPKAVTPNTITKPIPSPKKATEIKQKSAPIITNPTNSNNINTTVNPTTTTRVKSPKPQKSPIIVNNEPDHELITALSNNPFALIRDGKPKRPKPRKENLPMSSKSTKSTAKPVEDLVEEVIKIEPKEVFVPIDTSVAALNQQNPFRLEGSPEDRKVRFALKKIKFNPQAGSGAKNTTNSTSKPIFDTSKVDVNPLGTLKFSLSILLLGFLSFIMTRFRSDVNDIYKAFLSQNLMSLLYREKGTILKLSYVSLYVLTILSVGTMTFLTTSLFGVKIFQSNLGSLISCIAGVAGIYIGRHFLLSLLSYVFPFSKEINLYSFTIAIFNYIIGIVLLPFIIFIAFAPSNTHITLVYIALFAIFLIYIFRTIRTLIITNKYLTHSKFHFFMYLCTVEIAPILILLKLVGF